MAITTYTWTGANGADWSVAGDWSPNGGPPGIPDFAFIPGGSTVDVAQAESIDRLNLAAAAQLLLSPFQFTVAGSIDDAGLVLEDGTLAVAGSAVTLTGGGTLALGGTNSSSIISGVAVGDVLVNASGTITGTGTIGFHGLSLINNAGGVIDAAGPGALILGESEVGMANAGLMEATTGTLLVQGDVANGGTIAAAGGTVDLSDAVFSGGTLASSGGGAIFIDGGELDGSIAPIINAGKLSLVGGTAVLMASVSNTGTIFGNGSVITAGAVMDNTGGTMEANGGLLSFQGALSGGQLAVDAGATWSSRPAGSAAAVRCRYRSMPATTCYRST